jgi:hypothetical protein
VWFSPTQLRPVTGLARSTYQVSSFVSPQLGRLPLRMANRDR